MTRDAPTIYSRTGHFGRPESFGYVEPPVRVYGRGRICARQGCGTELSDYNPDAYCGLHTDDQYASLQHQCTEEGLWVCPECGRELLPDLRYWRADPGCKDGLAAVCKRCERR